MHRDNKERNRVVKEMANRQTSIPKHPSPSRTATDTVLV